MRKRKRDERPADLAPMQMTDRDKAILQAVHEYRVMKQQQLKALFFGTDVAASRVLQRLYDHGFLERRLLAVVYGRSPTLYVLGRRGADLLRAEYSLENVLWYPPTKSLSLEFLDHTLAINDVRIAITNAAKTPGYELRQWIGETELKADYDRVSTRRTAGQVQSVSLIPDGYFVLKTPFGLAPVFLELDRGTMDIASVTTKVLAYLTYHRSGAFKKRYNAEAMRVMIVTTSEKRLQKLKAAAETAGAGWQFVFAVIHEATEINILTKPIWWVVGESRPGLLFT